MSRFARLLCGCVLLLAPFIVSGCERAQATPGPPAPQYTVTPVPDDAPTVTTQPLWAVAFGGITDGITTDRKVVALTFDDGPTPRTTRIVDELDAAGAHATFFWVGSRITSDAAEYAMTHGDEMANHTWSHPDMHFASSQDASREIGWTSARIAQFTGLPPIWFRSPYNRLFDKELRQVQAHGLLYANYNVTSIDWMKGTTERGVIAKVNETLRPGGILLMHDSPTHDPTYLPALLASLKAQGYEMVTLSDLGQMGPPVNEPLTLGSQGLGY